MFSTKSAAKDVKRRTKINIDGCLGRKRNMYRDSERQRRQEMAALCSSLRSLLPLEYIKGKRAICDHIEQAVNYINDMQKKIEEAKARRNKLVVGEDAIKVNVLRGDEMEILITAGGLNEECFPLSKVLAYLLGLGLNVTTSLSTIGHQYSVHKLHIEHSEMITSIDISELKQRLFNLIKVA